MKKITFFLMAAWAAVCLNASAQTVVKTWDFTVWSPETVANLIADANSASPTWAKAADPSGGPANPDFSSWSRVSNCVTLPANTNLSANGVEIEELKGVFFWAVTVSGSSGNLNLRFNFGDDGIQFGSSNHYFGLANLTAGQTVEITFKSASGGQSRGISGITNLTGPTGTDAHAVDDPLTFTYTVVADGNVQWTYDSGILLKKIEVKEIAAESPTLSLSSGSTAQTVYAGQPISDIVYRWGGTATSASVTWDGGTAPAGITVTPDADAKTVTISGTPSAAGTYNYSVVATDGTNNTDPLSGTITVNELSSDKKFIAYVTTLASPVDPADIAVLAKLRESYNVDIVTANAAADAAKPASTFDVYDAIVLAALPGSGNVPNCLKGIDKPLVSLKPFMFQNANSNCWDWGTPANVESASTPKALEDVPTGVAVVDATHPIFAGMGLSNGDVVQLATDSKHASFRILTPIIAWQGDNESNIINLAGVQSGTFNYATNPSALTDVSGMPVIFEIKSDAVMVNSSGASVALTKKNICIGVSEQAAGPADNSATYLTPDYLTLVKNAVDYVSGGGTGIKTPTVDSNKVVVNKAYFDLLGRKVSAGTKGFIIEKSYYEDGTTGSKKVFIYY